MAKRIPISFKIFIGLNSTGKSAIAEYYASLAKLYNPNVTVVGYDPQNRFKGIMDQRYRIRAGEAGWWNKIKHLRNVLFIADDFRALNRDGRTKSDFYDLCEFRAEHNIDIILIAHGPKHLLSGLQTFVSHIYIFYMQCEKGDFQDKIEQQFECELAKSVMTHYVKHNPDVIRTPEKFYDSVTFKHRFPHIIVDAHAFEPDKKLIPQNFDKKYLEENWKRVIKKIEEHDKQDEIF